MTVPTTARRAGPYSGNGSTTTFSFSFKTFAATDLQVTKTGTTGIETALVKDSDYSVSLNVNQETSPGGSITYPISGTALATGEKLVIVGNLAYEQTTDLLGGGAFNAQVIEDTFDRTVIQIQQLEERADRAITIPVSSTASGALPVPAAGKVIAWNSTATALINRDVTDFATTAAYSNWRTDCFSGNASTTAFTLSADPGNVHNMDVSIGGVTQQNGVDFTVSGTTLTFTSAPPSGTNNVLARYGQALPVGTANASQVTFDPAGTGAVERTVESKLRDVVSVKDFGAVGNGVADDSGALELAVNAALASGRAVYFPPGDYNINTAKSFTYSGDLRLFGTGASLLMTAGSPVALAFNATAGATTTLAAAVTDGDRSITVTSASGIAEGQLIYLSTNTAVDSGYSYKKQAVFLVSNVSGTTIYLSEPSNFSFTTAETTVTTFQSASLFVDGVNIKQNGADKRFDLSRLQNFRLENLTIEAYSEFLGDVVFISACNNAFGRNLRLIKGRYTINASNGSRNLFFDDIFAKDCRHPIDCNTWTFNTRISRLTGINTQNAIQCHPCFEVHFEDCTDFNESSPTGGIGLRCIGGSAKRIKTSNINNTAVNDVQGAFLLSAYQYLGQKYDRIYEDIESNTAILSATDVRALFVRNCKVPSIVVDGDADRLGRISIDTKTVTTNAMTLRRIRVLSPDPEVFIENPTETFASVNTIKDITGITKANPAVVTAVAHGYSNGALIRIDGVVGMTQVNERTFTIANVTTDTFELSGENSSGYTTYTSGGKATLGRLAKTIDPTLTPGLGFFPSFKARALLRKTGATLNPLTEVTVPVRVRNVYNIQEENIRHVLITVRAMSSSDGNVVNKYQAYFFTGSTSASSISSVQAVVPAISTLTAVVSNLRHHYYTQVDAEGGDPNNDSAIGQYYYSFDVVVTANSTSDRIQYVEVEVDEIRSSLT